MTQKDKELLLKDICARLPYGVKVAFEEDGELITDRVTMIGWPSDEFMLYGASEFFTIEDIKPYLRPMSSMTEEEKKEYDLISGQVKTFYGREAESRECTNLIDYLIVHHFDYRGLIEKGLALEAPEGMYNEKEK